MQTKEKKIYKKKFEKFFINKIILKRMIKTNKYTSFFIISNAFQTLFILFEKKKIYYFKIKNYLESKSLLKLFLFY